MKSENTLLSFGNLMTLDSAGQVTIDGNLTVTGLTDLAQLTTTTATISGTLYATDIINPALDNLASRSASLEALVASMSAELSTLKSQFTQSETEGLATPSATSTISAQLP
jgi:hypothetical protein